MTVELDRDDLVNLIIGCSGPYYTIMDKYNEKGLNLGHYVGGFVDSWRWNDKCSFKDLPDTYIFKYRSTYNTDIEFVGIDSNLMNSNLVYFVDGE